GQEQRTDHQLRNVSQKSQEPIFKPRRFLKYLLEGTPAKKSRRFVDLYTMIFNNSHRGSRATFPALNFVVRMFNYSNRRRMATCYRGLILVVGNHLGWLR